MSKEKAQLIIGNIKLGKKNIRINIKNKPYFSDKSKTLYFIFKGKNAKSILEPSRGGIGSKLKTAKARFINTTKLKMVIRGDEAKPKYIKDLIRILNNTATKMFEAGPAKEISGSATCLFLKL